MESRVRPRPGPGRGRPGSPGPSVGQFCSSRPPPSSPAAARPTPPTSSFAKKNQALEAQVQTLTAQHDRDTQTIGPRCRPPAPPSRTLPPDRLASLYTTHGVEFTSATAGDNPDAAASFDTQLKLGLNAVDQDGTSIKAAGSFKNRSVRPRRPRPPAHRHVELRREPN